MDSKPHYAIMRIGKIKSFAVLDAVEWHNTRQIPAGTVEGAPAPQDFVAMEGSFRDRANKVLRDLGATFDEGKVLAVEVLLTASPEWWPTASKDDKREWMEAQWRFANDLAGPGLISFVPHNDESSPHIQFVMLPLYHAKEGTRGAKPRKAESIRRREQKETNKPKIWRLSHDKIFGGGPKGLAKLQTRYHGYVAHLGLSRGRDTVGLGIKHQTLKEYKKLLTQMERDLARQAEEQREERDVLNHYNQEVGEKHKKLDQALKDFQRDQLEFFAQEEALRNREEGVEAREKAQDDREVELDRRQAELEANARSIAEQERANRAKDEELSARQASLEEQEQAHAMARKEHERERELLALTKTAVGEREEAARKEDSRLKGEAYRQNIVASQLSIIGGFFTGTLRGRWDQERQRPTISTGKITNEQAMALASPWTGWLAIGARQASEMATKRAQIAAKIRKILNAFRAKGRRATERLRVAQAAEVAASRRLAEAETAEARSKNAEEAASERLAQAKSVEDLLEAKIKQADGAEMRAAEAQAAAAKSQRELDLAEGKAAEAGREYEILIGENRRLREEMPELREQRASLEAEKDCVAADVAQLRSQQTSLRQDKEAMERERKGFEGERDRFARSRELIRELREGKWRVEVSDRALRFEPVHRLPGQFVQVFQKTDVEDWLPQEVTAHNELMASRRRVEDLGKDLEERRNELIKAMPEREDRLRDDQREETKLINAAIGQVSAARDAVIR